MFKLTLSKDYLAGFADATEKRFKTPFKKGLFTVALNAISPKGSQSEDDSVSDSPTNRTEIVDFERYIPHSESLIWQPQGPDDKCPKITIFNGPYEYGVPKYKSQLDWYMIFANKSLGGGYLNTGFVQEEVIMMECPELSIFVSNFDVIGPMRSKEITIYRNVDRAGTILLYGRKDVDAVCQAKRIDYKEVIDTKVGRGKFNFMAVDAVNISGKAKASQADLMHTYNKLVGGFQTLKRETDTIHTGKLGCGAFGNDIMQIFTLTVLAAWIANIEVKFYLYDGVGRGEIQQLVDKLVAGKISFIDLYKTVLKN